MTRSIGHRWKGSDVRSRVVLIARWLAQCARRTFLGAARRRSFFFSRVRTRTRSVACFHGTPCPIIMSTIYTLPGEAPADDLRWPWRRGPPLSIPNREVKPVCADGTATPSGRVGRRLFLGPLCICAGALFLCDRPHNPKLEPSALNFEQEPNPVTYPYIPQKRLQTVSCFRSKTPWFPARYFCCEWKLDLCLPIFWRFLSRFP